MTYPNSKNNYHKKIPRINDKKFIGRAHMTEPIIISGKYFGIKLLSVYEFMECLEMENTLAQEIISRGFDKSICKKICEYACLACMCLYNSKNRRIFSTGMEVLGSLTAEELKFIYEEYAKLLDKVARKDRITQNILEKAKKDYNK